MHTMHSLSALPPLEGLVAVLSAARVGSFVGAAEDLGLTHGSVSRRVAAVERWLGTRVFERHGRGVSLTPAGQRFVREVEQALGAIAQTSDRWRPDRGRPTIRLNVVPSFAKLWLLPRLAGILAGAPDLRLDLQVHHRPVDLEAGEADLVVRYGRGRWPGLHVEPLFQETLLPVAAPGLARRLSGQTATDWSRQPLINDSDTSQWRAWLAMAGVDYRPRRTDYRFEDYDLALGAAAGGLGVALLRTPLAQAWIDRGDLALVDSRPITNPMAHYIVRRRDEHREGVILIAAALQAAAGEKVGPP